MALVTSARQSLSALAGVDVLSSRAADHPAGALAVDPAKLVVLLSGTGADGQTIEADLLSRGITLEMAERDVLVPIVTMADDESSVSTLVDVLTAAIERHRGTPRSLAASAVWTLEPEISLDPRQAFFAPHETVSAESAVGRVCAELIAPYPPGITLLAPGEIVTAAVIAALRRTLANGGGIAYVADSALSTIQVVAR